MARKNKKTKTIANDNSIKKSNELSMAKLNQGLTLNQMQLFAYAIFNTQQDGKTTFRKHEFQDKFGVTQYRTEDAYIDSGKISSLQFSTQNLEQKKFKFFNVFGSIDYDNGIFTFKWNADFIPHILELKTYSLIDLTIVSKFKSGFSWTLYEYLKAHFGNWHKELSKESLMKLFNVEDRVTYQKNTNRLKSAVLDVAIKEINEHTEFEVWYTDKRIGNKITGFILHWSTGETVIAATKKQVNLLREIHGEVENNMYDYLTLKNNDSVIQAKDYIITINDIKMIVKKGLSIKQADEYIKESLSIYDQLESLLENDGKERDRSFYYNWLEDD